jgi:hypothetical protein
MLSGEFVCWYGVVCCSRSSVVWCCLVNLSVGMVLSAVVGHLLYDVVTTADNTIPTDKFTRQHHTTDDRLQQTTPYQQTNSPDNIIPQMIDYSKQHHTNRQIHQTTSYHRWPTTADNTIPTDKFTRQHHTTDDWLQQTTPYQQTNSPDNIIPQMTDYSRQHHTNRQIHQTILAFYWPWLDNIFYLFVKHIL